MAWNEPGGNGDKDPWGNRGKNQSPPDLDEVIRNIQKKFGSLFGGKGGSGGGSSGGSGGAISGLSFGLVAAVIAVLWLASGFYKIQEAERGIVMLFGKHVSTADPGLGWHIPYPIENVIKVDITKVSSIPLRATMLTQDENIIDVAGDVQYVINDPVKYLFSVRSPERTLSQAAESALRQTIGSSKMGYVITEGRAQIASQVKEITQKIMNSYNAGIFVSTVNITKAAAPEAVKDAFDDVAQSREDQARLKNEAEAYSNEVIPKARGAAARTLAEADAYAKEVVARAQGQSERFLELLKSYKKAPKVTKERMYIDMMESVLNKSSKVLLDTRGGNNMIYLPLGKMMSQDTAMPSTNTKMTGVPDAIKQAAMKQARQDIQNNQSSQDGRTRGGE